MGTKSLEIFGLSGGEFARVGVGPTSLDLSG